MIKIQHILVTILLVLLILISNAFVFGYSIPLKELPPQLNLESYNSAGHLIYQKTIDVHDPVYQKLKELLYKNNSGWKLSIIGYPPGIYTFRGKFEAQPEFTIRCCYDGDTMVADIAVLGQYLPFVKHIPNTLQTLELPNLRPDK